MCKQIIDACPYQGECSVSGCKRNDDGCFVRQLFEERYRAENQIVDLNKKVQAKEQECEELEFKSNYFQMVYNERTQECQELERRLKNTGEEKDIHIKEKEYLYKELEKAEQKLEKIKEIVNTHKQNRCKACSEFDKCLGHPYCDEVILKIIEE